MRRGLVRPRPGPGSERTAARGRCTGLMPKTSPLFELARVLVRLDHVARFIINANHSIVRFGRTANTPHMPLLFLPFDVAMLATQIRDTGYGCIQNLTNRQSGAPCGEKAGNSSHLLGASTLAMTGITWSTTGFGSRSFEKS